jgi:DNA invertase Pin-like site-specific DNA recombinase
MAANKRVALYARVSTRDKGQNPELQLSELREYAARRDWQVVGEYVDEGYSGAKESRPALDQLMKDAKRRKFDAIVVWKLDRFGRSLKHLVTALADLDSLGVTFVSYKDNFDLTTSTGKLAFHVVGAMAEFERSLIAERVRAGIARVKAKGKHWGRPTVKLDMNAVRARLAAGESLRAIARSLRVSPSLLVKRAKQNAS